MKGKPNKGESILAKDHIGNFCKAKVEKTSKCYVYVSFDGWSKEYNEWVHIKNIRPLTIIYKPSSKKKIQKSKKKPNKKPTKRKLSRQEEVLRKYVQTGKIYTDVFGSMHGNTTNDVHFCVSPVYAVTYWLEKHK